MFEQERDRQDRRGRIRLLLASDVRRGAVHGFEHGRRRPIHVQVSGCGQSDAAGDGTGQVGEDVAEEVVGDNHIEARGIGDHVDGGGVHVHVVVPDVRKLSRNGLDRAAPQVSGVDEDVVLVDQRHVLSSTCRCPRKRVPHHALHPVGRVDRDLGGDFVGGSDTQCTTVPDVGSLGSLADDDEVDVAGVRERTGHTGINPRGPEVDVVVQREPQLEQHFALDQPGRDARVPRGRTDRAEEDRVMLAQGNERFVGKGLARLEPVGRAQAVVGHKQGDGFVTGRTPENLHGLGNDFGADSVPGDNGQVDGCAHPSTLSDCPDGGQSVSHIGYMVFESTRWECPLAQCSPSLARPRQYDWGTTPH